MYLGSPLQAGVHASVEWGFAVHRQKNTEGTAPSLTRSDLDMPAMGSDNAMGHRQTETQLIRSFPADEKGIENS
jgi:hypothetical protein